MTTTTDKSSRQRPSDEDLERGKAFAQWFKSALHIAQTTPSAVAKELGVTSGYLYTLANNGVKVTDGVSWYKRPSVELVRRIAAVLNANLTDGLRAAGYSADLQPYVPSALAQLPAGVQQKLALVVKELQETYEMDLVHLPVVGFVGAVGENFDVFSESHSREKILFPRTMLKNQEPEHCFVVVVRGECLVGSLITDGDLAICVQADTAKDGDIVAVVDGDNAVLKRYREVGSDRWLETDAADGRSRYQPEYPPVIIGRMIGMHREMK